MKAVEMEMRLCNPVLPPSKLAIHSDSRVISKLQPKIRIVHVFAPEIIKIDVANFREIVQKLTGKVPDQVEGSCRKRTRISCGSIKRKRSESDKESIPPSSIKGKKLKVEEETSLWNGDSHSSGFLDGFADYNGFLEDMSETFSLAPPQSSHTELLGYMRLS